MGKKKGCKGARRKGAAKGSKKTKQPKELEEIAGCIRELQSASSGFRSSASWRKIKSEGRKCDPDILLEDLLGYDLRADVYATLEGMFDNITEFEDEPENFLESLTEALAGWLKLNLSEVADENYQYVAYAMLSWYPKLLELDGKLSKAKLKALVKAGPEALLK